MALGEPTAVRHPDGSWEETARDFNGNRTRQTRQPLGLTRRYYYNTGINRLTAVDDELGHRTRYEYDDYRNLIRQTDPLGGVTQYQYTAEGLLSTVTDPLNHTTTYEYDALGNLWQVTNPLGHTTVTDRDAAGNVTAVTDPNGVSAWPTAS